MPSKRSVLNLNFQPGGREYAPINALQFATPLPFGTTYNSGAVFNSDVLDDAGWPTTPFTSGKEWGMTVIYFPDSDDFNGPYLLTWEGTGRFNFTSGAWTINAGLSSGYSVVNSQTWDGTNPRIVMTADGFAGGSINFRLLRSDPSSSGAYVKNLRFMRLEDEADYLAGNLYRTAWKQEMLDSGLGALRTMNWFGGNGGNNNGGQLYRFEQRTVPGISQILTSLPYGETTGTNQYSLAGVTGTPVAMTHGECAMFRVGNAMVRGGSTTITSVTKAAAGVVTYSGADNVQDGDTIVFQVSAGMVELNYRTATVSSLDTGANTFQININTTAFTTFTAGTFKQYISLNVGSRGAYPVIFKDGVTPASNFSSAYIAAADYKTVWFDATLSASTDGSGNAVMGAWIFNDLGAFNPPGNGVPLEYITKLLLELNAMASAQGAEPIAMWANMPYAGMLAMDPDYSAGSNMATGMIDVILNGANGYDGLKDFTNHTIPLILEFSNETWNSGGAFSQATYLPRRGKLRWPATGSSDVSNFQTLRAVLMTTAITAAFPSDLDRIEFVMAGQGTLGISGTNDVRINGSSVLDTDADYIAAGGGDPIDYFDGFVWASYFEAAAAYDTANLANFAATYVAAGTTAAQQAACALYAPGVGGVATVTISIASPGVVTQIAHGHSLNQQVRLFTTGALPTGLSPDTNYFVKTIPDANTFTLSASAGGAIINTSGTQSGTHTCKNWTGEQVFRYRELLLAAYATELANHGKWTGQYEGGWNHSVTSGTADVNTYMVAVKGSNSWANLQAGFMRAFMDYDNAYYPAIYVMMEQRWGHAWPDTYLNGVEGAGFDEAWDRIALYNEGKFMIQINLT